ncbi:MAG: ABC transporter ATP-binding protein, partial [Bacteroidota bacterium]
TFIVSTHQVRDLQSLLDSIVVLDQGKIIFQNSLMAIMEQFCFEIRYLEPSDVLYYERVPGGYFCIQPNLGQESLEVDIEILFNAILAKGIHFPEPFNLIQS